MKHANRTDGLKQDICSNSADAQELYIFHIDLDCAVIECLRYELLSLTKDNFYTSTNISHVFQNQMCVKLLFIWLCKFNCVITKRHFVIINDDIFVIW